MFGLRDDLTVPLDGIDQTRMLECWRWRVDDRFTPWFATAIGDLVLVDRTGAVWFLDCGSGELEHVAPDMEAFIARARSPHTAAVWFGPGLVDSLRARGLVLAPGECYSYLTPPVAGGTFTPDNFRVYDLATHFRTWGQAHEERNCVMRDA